MSNILSHNLADTQVRPTGAELITGGRLKGRRVVVTGGGTGIGEAVARKCVAEGAKVALLGRRKATLDEVGRSIGAFAHAVDLRCESHTAAAFEEIALALDGIDALVNAAGVLDIGTFEESTLERWQASIESNLTVPFLASKAALPYLRQAAARGMDAAIVNIAALAGIMPGVSSSGYAAAKAGLLQFSRNIAVELGPDIRVNSVCPGAVDTPMMSEFLALDQIDKSEFVSRYTLGRLAHPNEVANVVAFLISEESSGVIGSNYIVDGGRAFR